MRECETPPLDLRGRVHPLQANTALRLDIRPPQRYEPGHD